MNDRRPVDVKDVLAARDARAERQRELLREYRAPLISLTMNIAGPIKNDPWIELAFREAVRRVEDQLARHAAEVLATRRTVAFTGCEQLWAVDAEALPLKKWMCAVEDADALGRLIDADVIDAAGRKLDRAGAGGAPRRCLLCGGPVLRCARSRAHSARDLYGRAREIIEGFFQDRAFAHIGLLAERALLYEAAVTPKPGLVDRSDSGAHRDMDLFTFLDSASALRDDFARCARVGWETRREPPEAVFARLRYAGQCAETHMAAATHGVNTHKGAIFSLGLLCAAAGRGLSGESHDRETLLDRASALAGPSLMDLKDIDASRARTGGERQYAELGLTGIRGEASAGFPSVRDRALPAYERARAAGKSTDAAGCEALVHLLASVLDSNVIRRGGMERQRALMRAAGALIDRGAGADGLRALNDWCVEENLSPGGCADLLAVTLFLAFWEEDPPRALPD